MVEQLNGFLRDRKELRAEKGRSHEAGPLKRAVSQTRKEIAAAFSGNTVIRARVKQKIADSQ